MDAVARLHRTTEGITMFTTNIARTTLRMVVGISLVGLTLGLNSEGFAQTRSTQFRSTRIQVAQLMNNWCVSKNYGGSGACASHSCSNPAPFGWQLKRAGYNTKAEADAFIASGAC
jgi:hypothetical protein